MTFYELTEKWAILYKPFSHNPSRTAKPADKAYYMADRLDDQCEFVRNFNTAKSPCLVQSTAIDCEMHDGKLNYTRVIYFMKKANGNQSRTQKQDDYQQTKIKEELDGYIHEFVAYLNKYKREHQEDNALRGIDPKNATFATMPMMWNGWIVCGLSFDQILPAQRCITEGMYRDESEVEL